MIKDAAYIVPFPFKLLIFLFLQVKPGLSSYASDPKAAAESLKPLLLKAADTVPTHLQSETPVKVGVSPVYFFSRFKIWKNFRT